MSVGLGALHDGWTAFEEDEGRAVRAEQLDECLAIYAGLLRGQPFSYEGRHFSENGEGRELTGPDELSAPVDEVQVLRSAAGLAAEPYDVVLEADSTRELAEVSRRIAVGPPSL